MVTWKLATRLSLVILILIFAAACSREGETTHPTSTPTLDSTAITRWNTCRIPACG